MKQVPVSTSRVLAFAGYLRRQGYRIGVGEMPDLVRSVAGGGVEDPVHTRRALRALCCRSLEEWKAFGGHFDRYWFPMDGSDLEMDAVPTDHTSDTPHGGVSGIAGTSDQEPDSTHGQSHIDGSGAGRQRTLGKADFRFLRDRGAMQEVELLAEQLGRQLRRKPGRRRRTLRRGDRLDIRQTFRHSLNTGGVPIQPCWSQRRPMPLHLVILHDVSHSMTWNNPLLFRFVRGLIQGFPVTSVFAFHTRLFEVTHFFRERSLDRMRKRLEAGENLWLGGTCIARSIATFNEKHARTKIRSDTHVIIISDGFDTDDPALLRRELEQLHSRCRQILWLNPMLGRKGVELTAESLSERLPEVDRFLSANSLDGLRAALTVLS